MALLGLLLDAQPEADVVGHGHVREQRVGLEDHAHVALVGRQVRDVLAVDLDAARVGVLEAGDHAQRRRLAAAGRPEEGDELAALGGEDEVLDRGEGAELLLDVGQLQEAHACLAHQWAPPISIRVRVSRPMKAMAIIASQVSPKLMSATAAGS